MAEQDIKVFDAEGNLRTLEWLRNRYGHFIIQPAAAGYPRWEISALYEERDYQTPLVGRGLVPMAAGVPEASSTLVVLARAEGGPANGVRVAFYWPDAPADPEAGPMGGVLPQMRPGRAVSGVTEGGGATGFGMGGGAFYWPSQGQIGPHAAWIHGTGTRSDLILGLGMVGGTNHDHFDVEFTRIDAPPSPPQPPPPEPPPPEPPPSEWKEAALKVLALLDEARGVILELLEEAAP